MMLSLLTIGSPIFALVYGTANPEIVVTWGAVPSANIDNMLPNVFAGLTTIDPTNVFRSLMSDNVVTPISSTDSVTTVAVPQTDPVADMGAILPAIVDEHSMPQEIAGEVSATASDVQKVVVNFQSVGADVEPTNVVHSAILDDAGIPNTLTEIVPTGVVPQAVPAAGSSAIEPTIVHEHAMAQVSPPELGFHEQNTHSVLPNVIILEKRLVQVVTSTSIPISVDTFEDDVEVFEEDISEQKSHHVNCRHCHVDEARDIETTSTPVAETTTITTVAPNSFGSLAQSTLPTTSAKSVSCVSTLVVLTIVVAFL